MGIFFHSLREPAILKITRGRGWEELILIGRSVILKEKSIAYGDANTVLLLLNHSEESKLQSSKRRQNFTNEWHALSS